MEKLSQLAETLIGSEIVKLGNEINDRKRRGEEIYNYTIGDFDPEIFPIPNELKELVIESYNKHYTNYPPADGVNELRSAVSGFIKKYEGLDYNNNEILIAAGGRPLIYAIFKTVVDKDDKVIYAVPSWNNNHYVHMNNGQHCVIEASLENNFMPTASDIAPHIKDTALICLCSPQNPTGTTLQKEELEKICDLVLEENKRRGKDAKKLYVMYDQMYWLLTYGTTQHHNPVSLRPAMKDYTIFVDGMSKAFSATGLRVGWSLGPAHVIGKMKALLTHMGGWSPMPEQKAAAKYLQQYDAIDKFIVHYKKELEYRLNKIYEGFINLKKKGYPVDAVAPQAAIYLTIKLALKGQAVDGKPLASQEDVTAYLLDKAHLAVVPFSAFGASQESPWYRLSVGTCRKEDIDVMLQALEKALETLNCKASLQL